MRFVLLSLLILALFTGCNFDKTADKTNTPPLDVSQRSEVSLNEKCQNVLDNKAMLYDADTNEKMYIGEFLGNRELEMSKYSTVDLNGDSIPEVVGWLSRGTNDCWGFLILHYDNDMVYAYELAYRAFNNLKKDGTFSFSSSVSDHGIGKIEFMSGTYKINKIASSEAEYETQKVSYYIDNVSVSKEDFYKYVTEQNGKQDVEWNEITLNSTAAYVIL